MAPAHVQRVHERSLGQCERHGGRGAVNDDALILELTDHDLLGIAA